MNEYIYIYIYKHKQPVKQKAFRMAAILHRLKSVVTHLHSHRPATRAHSYYHPKVSFASIVGLFCLYSRSLLPL